MKKTNRNRKNKQRRLQMAMTAVLGAVTIGIVSYICIMGFADKESGNVQTSPEQLLIQYMSYITEKEYGQMYAMLDMEASGFISREDFIKRNSAIYEGIELQNMEIEIISYDKEREAVHYQSSLDTVAGNIRFKNEAFFREKNGEYRLVWDDALIFPVLTVKDKVKVSTTQAKRGEIRDRNGRILAGEDTASSVGIVPGKLENRDEALHKMAELLEIEPQTIEKKLSAKWVKEDSFVPIQTIPKVEEIDVLAVGAEEEVLKESERQKKLLQIPGVMLSDTEVRAYPLGEAAAHLVGYVQSVTAEDLEEHAGEGYMAGSVIGRSGAEGLYEKERKGRNGYSIYSAFCNEGNMIKPYLRCRDETAAESWIANAFSEETANRVLEGTKKIVNNSHGTGYAAHRDDIVLAGKTGTAEIKVSQEDTSGTELGWFAVYTAEKTVARPIMIISMVEDVKDRGGSGYVVEKDRMVLEEWFLGN